MTLYSPKPVPGAGGRRPGADIVEPCNVILKVIAPNAHLKTKTHWVLGWVPPDGEGPRYFYAGWRWERHSKKGSGGFVRYWGYAEFDGRKNYGWIDQGTYEVTSRKWTRSRKPKPYDVYRAQVDRMMKAAWRYRNKEHQINKRPVRALLPSPPGEKELPVYRNPWEGGTAPRTPDPGIRRSNEAGGFILAVRWAMDGWILVKAGGKNEDWVFIKGSYRDLQIIEQVSTPIGDKNSKRKVLMKRNVQEMTRADIKKYAKTLQGGP